MTSREKDGDATITEKQSIGENVDVPTSAIHKEDLQKKKNLQALIDLGLDEELARMIHVEEITPKDLVEYYYEDKEGFVEDYLSGELGVSYLQKKRIIKILKEQAAPEKQSAPVKITNPNDCEVMISFNNATAGEDAEELCNFLNRKGKKAFCTRVFCPNNMGDLREYTVVGANKCKVFIALMTDGWQNSNECQFETNIIKTRIARERVQVIPVYYKSFDYDFDEDSNHFYGTSWASYQGIPNKEANDNWMESVLKLLDHLHELCSSLEPSADSISKTIKNYGTHCLTTKRSGESPLQILLQNENFDAKKSLLPILSTILEEKPSFYVINHVVNVLQKWKSINTTEKENQECSHQIVEMIKYRDILIDEELSEALKNKETVPLNRYTIFVVGRGRDGKTSTINSIKGLPFDSYSESTIGSAIGEIEVPNVADIGAQVSSVEVLTGLGSSSFNSTEKDKYAAKRAIAVSLLEQRSDEDKNLPPKQQKRNRSEKKETTVSAQKGNVPNLEPISKPGNNSVKDADEDVAEKKGEVDLKIDDGSVIRYTIFDNGGQTVFRSVQQLLLSRRGIYVVVFNIMNLIQDETQQEALDHLEYWLSSIEFDAKSKDVTLTDISKVYPPVLLVGTHLDQIRKIKDSEKCIQKVNQLLLKTFGCLWTMSEPSDGKMKIFEKRSFLYNKEESLCFWPVDNTKCDDKNIKSLRECIIEATINDTENDRDESGVLLPIVKRKMPIALLDAMDRLTELSQDIPILPLLSSAGEPSVVSVMKEANVFDEKSLESEETCKQSAIAVLKEYHSIGHFIYFFDIEALQNYCILNPQWLINMITYIVRDFRLHRLKRDYDAIDIREGDSWKSLLERGILDITLLRKLWLGNEHEEFLVNLLLEIGIFGQPSPDKLKEVVFTVPICITIQATQSVEVSMPFLLAHLSVESTDELMQENIVLSSCTHNLIQFYCRVANILISEWNTYEENSLPQLLPRVANLRLGPSHRFSLLINEETTSLVVYTTSDSGLFDTVFKYVTDACNTVNNTIYNGRLTYNIPARNNGEVSILRDQTIRGDYSILSPPGVQFEDNNQTKLIQFLTSRGINERLSETFAKIMFQNDEYMTKDELIFAYHRPNFEDRYLYDMGIKKSQDINKIMQALDGIQKPLPREEYVLANLIESPDLDLEDEKKLIEKNLRQSNFIGKFLSDRKCIKVLNELGTAQDEYKVIHFSMHKNAIDASTISCLVKSIGDSNEKCLFLNTCDSYQIVSKFLSKKMKQKLVCVYWKSKVDNRAAKIFAEGFYFYLCRNGNRQNCCKFLEAFEDAKNRLELYGFICEDPLDMHKLDEMRKQRGNAKLVAAGIPDILVGKEEGHSLKSKNNTNCSESITDTVEIIEPHECKVMISFNDGSAGEDAENLTDFLTNKGHKTFCTRIYCPNHRGSWRDYTSTGMNTCEILIVLLTEGWQRSNECQWEIEIAKTRLAEKEIEIIPVWYESFNDAYDKDEKHFYRKNWKIYQGLQSKENDSDWKQSILKLIEPCTYNQPNLNETAKSVPDEVVTDDIKESQDVSNTTQEQEEQTAEHLPLEQEEEFIDNDEDPLTSPLLNGAANDSNISNDTNITMDYRAILHKILDIYSDQSGSFSNLSKGLSIIFALGTVLGLVMPKNQDLPTVWYQSLSSIIGYSYFLSWSVSFYPQLITNYQQRCIEGLSTDSYVLAVVNYTCYTIYNMFFFFSTGIRQEYQDRHGQDSKITVQSNDVAFAIHALILNCILMYQIAYYGGFQSQPISKVTIFIVVGTIVVSLGYIVCIYLLEGFLWIDFLYLMATIKLGLTILTYLPQILLNFQRKSTQGWNLWNVIFDCTGGVLSLLQLVWDSVDLNDVKHGLLGNVPKLILSFITLACDGLFFLQHHIYQDENDSISHTSNGDDRSTSYYALLNEDPEEGIHDCHPTSNRGRDDDPEEIHTEFE